MKNCIRKAFTLVELLIVIVVIGVLAAMLMLSSTEAVSSAKATKIISDLRLWKTAVLAWYTDHLDSVAYGGIRHGQVCVEMFRPTKYPSVADDAQPIQEALQKVNNRQLIINYMNGGSVSLGGANNNDKSGSKSKDENNNDVYVYAKPGGYEVHDGDAKNVNYRHFWSVGYYLTDSEKSTLAPKLAARAKSIGLYQTNKYDSPYYTNGSTVWMKILNF